MLVVVDTTVNDDVDDVNDVVVNHEHWVSIGVHDSRLAVVVVVVTVVSMTVNAYYSLDGLVSYWTDVDCYHSNYYYYHHHHQHRHRHRMVSLETALVSVVVAATMHSRSLDDTAMTYYS